MAAVEPEKSIFRCLFSCGRQNETEVTRISSTGNVRPGTSSGTKTRSDLGAASTPVVGAVAAIAAATPPLAAAEAPNDPPPIRVTRRTIRGAVPHHNSKHSLVNFFGKEDVDKLIEGGLKVEDV